MQFEEISMEDAFEDLKRDLESGKPLSGPSSFVRQNPPMLKEEFARIRKELDLTQAQLAERLDLSIKTIQAYEQGRNEPSGLTAKLLMRLKLLCRNVKFVAECGCHNTACICRRWCKRSS